MARVRAVDLVDRRRSARRPTFSALPTTNLVCGIGPSAASTSTMAPSTMDRMRSTSPPKSAWPGVSTMLMRASFQTTEVALARMVMPRSFSRSLESMARSATRWLSRNEPDCLSSASTSVVLPWSTCAMIAILRRFMLFNSGGNAGAAMVAACGADFVGRALTWFFAIAKEERTWRHQSCYAISACVPPQLRLKVPAGGYMRHSRIGNGRRRIPLHERDPACGQAASPQAAERAAAQCAARFRVGADGVRHHASAQPHAQLDFACRRPMRRGRVPRAFGAIRRAPSCSMARCRAFRAGAAGALSPAHAGDAAARSRADRCSGC